MASLGLWEIPMSVTGGLRIPLIGTSLLAGPDGLSARLLAHARRLDYFHLELHGMDLADPEGDGYAEALRSVQPELRLPLNVRLGRLRTLLEARGGGVPLREAVARRSRG
jgi:hypothetical protein